MLHPKYMGSQAALFYVNQHYPPKTITQIISKLKNLCMFWQNNFDRSTFGLKINNHTLILNIKTSINNIICLVIKNSSTTIFVYNNKAPPSDPEVK